VSGIKYFLSLWLLITPLAHAQWFAEEASIMGTRIAINLWQDDPAVAQDLIAKVFAELRRLDQQFSPYIDSSELSKVNRLAATQSMPVSDEMLHLIQVSNEYSQLTNGAFDITYASVGYLYDYRKAQKPDDASIQKLLPSIDYRHIQLGDHTVHFKNAEVKIDLGGIAKGYALDRGIAILKSAGVLYATLTAGGDSYFLGLHQDRPWNVVIQHPRDHKKNVLMLPVADMAVSTSGDYERYFIKDGERYHHIIQPKTGKSASELMSVTIIGQEAIRTDALSTSVFVLGVKDGLALINRLPDVDAVLIDRQGKMYYSNNLVPPEKLEKSSLRP
jgi:thiamine biosynthesis lipoprotein